MVRLSSPSPVATDEDTLLLAANRQPRHAEIPFPLPHAPSAATRVFNTVSNPYQKKRMIGDDEESANLPTLTKKRRCDTAMGVQRHLYAAETFEEILDAKFDLMNTVELKVKMFDSEKPHWICLDMVDSESHVLALLAQTLGGKRVAIEKLVSLFPLPLVPEQA